MLMADVSQSREDRGGDGNLVALLSLKLLLLAFFILLNADSQFEDVKANAVVDSVRQAFGGSVASSENLRPEKAALGRLDETGFVLQKVGNLFKSLVPIVRSDNTPHGPLLSFELSSGTVFRPGLAELQPGRDKLLDRLADVLSGNSSSTLDFELAFLIARPSAGEDPATDDALAMRRLQTMTRQLARRGLSMERFSTGLLPVASNRVRFVLRVFSAPTDVIGSDEGGKQ